MSIYTGNQKLKKLYIGNQAVRKAYLGNQLVYSAGNIVTYHVDAGVRYQEEVGEGQSCLSPKTFTPQKAGWTFVGWRADATASGDVISSLIMGDSPIELYAVFTHPVTVTYYNGSTTVSRQTKSRYWNNGNAASPSFALTQAAKSGWSARGWSTSAAGNGGITYANGATFSRDSDITLYGMYQQAVTLSYNGNGATGGSTAAQTGYRYYNSNGQTLNASLTVTASGYTRTGYLFTAWKSGSTTYSPGQTVAISASMVLTAQWASTASVSFAYNGGIQTYSVPVTGLYLLAAYGARGGSIRGNGAGNGGYAYRYVPLTAGQTIYIVCGQAGGVGDHEPATYNGGGSSGEGAPGGGATHIAGRSGTLRQLGSTSGLYIVAGGGGGGGMYGDGNYCAGGSGGGDSGERGKYTLPNYGITPGGGGTQSAAGASVGSGTPGGFGYGGSTSEAQGAGGGGGLYGGGHGGNYNGPCAGGGGSGYIGSATTVYKGKTYTNGQTVGGNTGDHGTASIKLIAV